MIRETEFRNRMSWQSRLRDSATARLRDQRGSALPVVLVLVVLLTVAGVAMVNSTLTETSIAYKPSESAAAQYAASAVQANNKLAAATAMTVNTTGANIIGGLTANGTISGVTCGIWAWTCNVSATVRAIPEIDMDSAATTSLKYRAQHTFDADGKYLYFKGGDTGRCNSGGAWTFDAAHTQQCWDYYVNSKSGTLGSGISNPVFFVEFNPSETTSYSTGGGGGGGGITTKPPTGIPGRGARGGKGAGRGGGSDTRGPGGRKTRASAGRARG